MPRIPYKNAAGKRVPGCTTICAHVDGSPEGLLVWANRGGLEGKTLDDMRGAADVGTWTHAAAEANLHGEVYEIPEEATPEQRAQVEQGIDNFQRWRDQNDPELVAVERSLISERHRFGGTLDYVMRIAGRTVLLDLKTGGIYGKQLVQLAGYGLLWSENYPDDPIDEYQLLGVGKEDGGLRWFSWPATDMEDPTQAFLLARQIYDLANALRKRVK